MPPLYTLATPGVIGSALKVSNPLGIPAVIGAVPENPTPLGHRPKASCSKRFYQCTHFYTDEANCLQHIQMPVFQNDFQNYQILMQTKQSS